MSEQRSQPEQGAYPGKLEKDHTAELSGEGFVALSQRRRKQFSLIFLITLATMIIVLATFGGTILWRYLNQEVVTFETPEPVRTYKPRKLEHRVKITKRQRSSSRPSVVPRIVAMKVSDLALPEIKVDPKVINTTFQPKFKPVSGKGFGAGLGGGYGTSGFGDGFSSVNFFGIQAKGERIAVCVDVSVSMVEDLRGGVPGYMRVKRRVSEVIDALSDGTLFNVIVFADGASTLWDEMKYAGNDTRNEAKKFIRPFNTEGHWGHDNGNISSSPHGLDARGGTTRLDLALTAVFSQGADTVLVISDGAPRVAKGHSVEAMQAHQNRVQQWRQANAGAISASQSAAAAAPAGQAQKVWIPPQPAVPPRKGPPKEGQKGDGSRPAQPGRWRIVTPTSGGGGPRAPSMPPPGYWTLADFVKHLNMMYEHTYKKKGLEPPVIHSIGYQIDSAGSAFLKGLSKEFHGQYRNVRSIR